MSRIYITLCRVARRDQVVIKNPSTQNNSNVSFVWNSFTQLLCLGKGLSKWKYTKFINPEILRGIGGWVETKKSSTSILLKQYIFASKE